MATDGIDINFSTCGCFIIQKLRFQGEGGGGFREGGGGFREGERGKQSMTAPSLLY